MSKNKKFFGQMLKKLRFKKGWSLRDVCRKVSYDPSNWSKVERGRISPPSDRQILQNWAKTLGLSSEKVNQFVDQAMIAQGIIPEDILAQKRTIKCLPAFFRTLRNRKPTKEEVDRLIELIRNA